MKTINILGDTQREQWHGVVNMLRQLGGDLTREGRSSLCDELDRYIDAMEDANEKSEQETVYALIYKEYCETSLVVDVNIYGSLEQASDAMQREYSNVLSVWKFDTGSQDEFHRCFIDFARARIDDYTDFAEWIIEEKKVRG